MFLDQMKTDAEVSGWKDLCKVNGKSQFIEYDRITIEVCQNNLKTYFKLDKTGDIKTSCKGTVIKADDSVHQAVNY